MNKYIVQMFVDDEDYDLVEHFMVISDIELDEVNLVSMCVDRYNEYQHEDDKVFSREYVWEIFEVRESLYEVIDLRKDK